ncbi:methyltransferase domain-containing protein [Trichoderma austrokoningii]
MLPTPDTSHVPYERVYEPAEDSFLLLDTLSSASETQYLHETFSPSPSPNATIPFVVELGTGSGVVLAFITAHAKTLFGTNQILTAGVDMNAFACRATIQTVEKAQAEAGSNGHGLYLGSVMGDLAAPLRRHSVDVLVFNPPYVPTSEMPSRPETFTQDLPSKTSFDDDSYLLSLSYAGGKDGMETTDRLIDALPEILSSRGCAYLLLCAQNKPEEVKARIRAFGAGWRAVTVGSSGKTAGWEKLQIVRIWRDRLS